MIGRDTSALPSPAALVGQKPGAVVLPDALRLDCARTAWPVSDLILAATQANLLALKATVRAMRAGAAEGGFVVLAWKALAEQAARAIDEIRQQLAGVRDADDIPLDGVRAIGGAVERMAENCAAILCAAEEQAFATTAAYPDARAYQALIQKIRWQAGLSAAPPE